MIQKNFYKNNQIIKFIIYEYFEFFLTYKFSLKNFKYHKYFTNKMNYIKKFNLDEETFFIEFENTLLNG